MDLEFFFILADKKCDYLNVGKPLVVQWSVPGFMQYLSLTYFGLLEDDELSVSAVDILLAM